MIRQPIRTIIAYSVGAIACVMLGLMPASAQFPERDEHIKTFEVILACEDQPRHVCRIEFQYGYAAVAASQTDQVLGATGAAGDLLHSVVCVMSAASVGAVTIKDGTGAAITIIEAQAAATHVVIPLDIVSTTGAWKLSTGTNTTCLGVGRFT